LVHRSGLPLGAGDLMLFPRTDHTAGEILHALRYFKPVAGFRTRYAYDNVLYIVAAMVLERVSGMGWDQFVRKRIFEPLRMTGAVSNATLACHPNRAGRHARLGPPARGMGGVEAIRHEESAVLGPAGGIHLSATDMVPWLEVQLSRGALPEGRRLWTAARSEEMWAPQTITLSGAGPTADCPERPVMQGYALGWGVNDYRGQRMMTHGGAVAGQVSRTVLLPERHVGIFVCFNSEEAQALSGLRYALIDRVLGAPEFDWIAATRNSLSQARDRVSEVINDGDFKAPSGRPSLPLARYAGRYRDPWYGDVVVVAEGGVLHIDFVRTPLFKSVLECFGVDCFRTRFPRGCEDAVVSFDVQDETVVRITLRALSPLADFSFDFHDLAFVPVSGAS
jgi:CubicO group peptidase (beta-lactamase class C family)